MSVSPGLVHMAEYCLMWSFLTGPTAVRAGRIDPILDGLNRIAAQ